MEAIRANLDEGTYAFFHNLARQNDALVDAAARLSFLGSYWFASAVMLITAFLLVRQARPRTALVFLAFFVVAAAAGEGIAYATARPRPGQSRDSAAAAPLSSSFPSRAVLISTYAWLAFAMAMGSLGRWRGIAAFAAAALFIAVVCLTRLILSAHYLTDILAGLAGGGGLALLARAVEPCRSPP